ncbi:MAG: GUN4 domain-containing protein [Cyanobacteria bacterium J06659_2]
MVTSPPIPWTVADLEAYLQAEDWRQADRVTTGLIAQAVEPYSSQFFEETAIAQLPCSVLTTLDQLWVRYSDNTFGFTPQQEIYLNEAAQKPLQFAKQVGWVISDIDVVGFFKFYRSLTFDRHAPRGQFPAHWYWQLSFNRSLWMGGFGTGRGAGYINPGLLDALMLRLERCGFV